jgi:hypothetical protein
MSGPNYLDNLPTTFKFVMAVGSVSMPIQQLKQPCAPSGCRLFQIRTMCGGEGPWVVKMRERKVSKIQLERRRQQLCRCSHPLSPPPLSTLGKVLQMIRSCSFNSMATRAEMPVDFFPDLCVCTIG